MNPWEKWTPEFLFEAATDARTNGFFPWAEMIESFASLLQSEREGKRCVLPDVFQKREIGAWQSDPNSFWVADCGGDEIGRGETKEAAIEDLVAKLRGEG